MEFGFFVQGYVPDYIRDGNPNAEHQVLMDDLEVCIAADKAGFKYIWVSEHHFLDQYSHLSANDVFSAHCRGRQPGLTWGRGSSIRCRG